MKITKEQVLEIYEATSVNNQEQLKQWFPEAFEAEIIQTLTKEEAEEKLNCKII